MLKHIFIYMVGGGATGALVGQQAFDGDLVQGAAGGAAGGFALYFINRFFLSSECASVCAKAVQQAHDRGKVSAMESWTI